MRWRSSFYARSSSCAFVTIFVGVWVLCTGRPAYGDASTLFQLARLTASDPIELAQLGSSVAISGDTVVGGAPNFGGPGAAYVFVKTEGGWSQQQKLAPDVAPTKFGNSVAISGDTIVVGSPFDSGAVFSPSGAAYVYVRSGTTWTLQQKLTASDTTPNNFFGFSVAISGETVLVGSAGVVNGPNSFGAAYVYVRNGSVWSEQQKLIPADGGAGFFGLSIALDADTAVVGDAAFLSSSAYVFARNGSSWSQVQKLTASDPAAAINFGESLALAGERMVIGAFHDESAGNTAGSAYVFFNREGTWVQEAKLLPADPVPPGDIFGKEFGGSVAIGGDWILAGARYDSIGRGAAYLFERSGTSWSQLQKLTVSAPSTSAFGLSVALDGRTAAIGSNFGMRANGAVFIFGQDTTPPIIHDATAHPSLLWPPNHRMVPVTVTLIVSDDGDPAPTCAIESITSTEPLAGGFSITGPLQAELRAERLETGPGRTYSILVGCMDSAGNRSQATVDVVVPHDQGGQ